jgi:sugar (pentulose or hexulose) kinase
LAEKIILAIDCGTQSLRVLLFSETGSLLDKAQVEYTPYFSAKSGWAEQDPEVYWNSLCKACEQLKAKSPNLFNHIAGVGVTTQRNSMINVDKNGTPLRPAVTWLDQRKARPVFGNKGLIKLGLKLLKMDGQVATLQAQGKCNWIMQNQPEIWDATYKYLQVSGFLNHRLTERFTDSVASQIGYIPFNYKKMKWAGKKELFAKFFPVEHEKLPEVVMPGESLGHITLKAYKATGIQEGVPVIACGSDKGCETLGAGVIDQKMVILSFGTTATVQTTTERYFEPIRFMPSYPATVPGHYNPEVEIFRGYWMITWFKNEFGYQEVLEAKERGIAVEKVLDRHLAETDPGAMGLVVQPYWGPGLEHPCAKGAMIGFGGIHTKAHIYRAVIEGLGFALRDGLEKIEKTGGVKAEKAAVAGGASQSDQICRITADIFNLPMVRGKTHETSGLGAAIITAAGIGLFSSLEEAVENMVKIDQIFTPEPEAAEIYESLYKRVYQKIYRSLGHLYNEIKDITGYPE